MKTPFFRATRGGKYQTLRVPTFRAKEEGDGDGQGDDQKLTKEQLNELNKITHKAITKRISDPLFLESIAKISSAAAEEAVARVTEGFGAKLDELMKSKPDDKPDDKKKTTDDWKEAPEYKAMIQRDKDRQAEHDAMIEEREAEKEAKSRAEERKSLESELRKQGIEEVKLRSCVATLIHEDKVMQRDSNGDIVYRIDRGEYNDDLGVAEGVADFLGTDEGKAFLPAAGAGGTGVRGNSDNKGNNSQRKGQRQTKEEAASLVSAWLGGNA